MDRPVNELRELIRDLFFSSRRAMREIYEEGKNEEGNLDMDGFTFVCKKYC